MHSKEILINLKPVFSCLVCGYFYNEPPWGEDGGSPTFDICSCCGCEFGFDDITIESVINYREEWKRSNLMWKIPSLKPSDWDLEKQLSNVPDEFK